MNLVGEHKLNRICGVSSEVHLINGLSFINIIKLVKLMLPINSLLNIKAVSIVMVIADITLYLKLTVLSALIAGHMCAVNLSKHFHKGKKKVYLDTLFEEFVRFTK